MDLTRLLRKQLPDWSQLRITALSPESWRVSGLVAGRARVLTLIRRGDGSWRLLELGRVRRLEPLQGTGPVADEADSSQELAPMEGVLRQVAVAAGERVTPGQRLYVLEAMKMQVQVTASQPGRILAVHAAAGERVRQGQQVLGFEPDSEITKEESDEQP